MRRCSKTGCHAHATSTLTYVYADSTAVVGPLALAAVPGSYDLCRQHSDRVTAPRGWEMIRLPEDELLAPVPAEDDLLALANAIREVGNRTDDVRGAEPLPPGVVVLAEKRHLRVIAEG
ncbi:DUF3499 domain-containing protein [Aestuariimicrobium ganziense]|uniref:DUF3499 domain-containing protein n=1 Tax=Aestuariimicrobium ganziense TaxID=2773677 RepID=UPI001942DC9D|nr:DUF3499 domain-containing protein [Aestuariimicrobium ganziense]